MRKKILVFCLLILSLIDFNLCFAASENKNEGFNAGDMIMHHILDSHEWHIMNVKNKHITIYLPVIIYSKERGLISFSSSKFQNKTIREIKR